MVNRLKPLAYILLLIVVINLLSWALAEWLLLSDLRRIERTDSQERLERLQAAFEREGDFLQRWAASRAVRILQTAGTSVDNEANIRAKVAWPILDAADIDLVAVQLHGKRPLVLFSTSQSDQESLLDDKQLVDQVALLLPRLFAEETRSGFMWIGAYPAVVATVPLDETDPQRGSVLALRLFDADTHAYLADILQRDFRFYHPHVPGSKTGVRVPSVAIENSELILISGKLPALAAGEPVGVEMLIPRLIYPQGLRMVRYYQLWLGGVSLLAGVIAWPVWMRLRYRRDQERLLNRMLRESGEALLLVRADGCIVLSNPKFEQLLGCTRIELRRLRVADLIGAEQDALLWQQLQDTAEGTGSVPVALQFVSRSGAQVYAEAVCSRLAFADEEHLLLQLRDISRRVAAERELQAASERYRLLFENNPLPMWVYRRDTLQFLAVNEAAVVHYQYARDEFMQMTIRDIRPPEEVSVLEGAVRERPAGLAHAGVWKHRKKDGTLIDVEIVLHSLTFDGHPANLVLLNDVTEQFRMRQDNERIARLAALGELAAGVAHEINNPNGMILRNLGFVGDVLADALPLLGTDGDGPQLGGLDYAQVCAQMPQLVADMQRGAGHIRDIVRDMKDFSRADEAGEQEPFALNQAVSAAVRLLEGPIRKATDNFSMDLSVDLPQACGSLRQIEQVVLNLLMNACQALPDRNCALRIVTRCEVPRQRVVLEVVDEGRGIAAADLPRITDPFFTTRREYGGTGLGLSVSARIVRQHRGTLDFLSEPGRGTRVTLSLPIH